MRIIQFVFMYNVHVLIQKYYYTWWPFSWYLIRWAMTTISCYSEKLFCVQDLRLNANSEWNSMYTACVNMSAYRRVVNDFNVVEEQAPKTNQIWYEYLHKSKCIWVVILWQLAIYTVFYIRRKECRALVHLNILKQLTIKWN